MNLSKLLFYFKKYTGHQMPFTQKDLDNLPISFAGKDNVWVQKTRQILTVTDYREKRNMMKSNIRFR